MTHIILSTRNKRRCAAALGLLLLICFSARAQKTPRLYITVNDTMGYAVGSPLSGSGLYRFEGSNRWTHIGWNHPKIWAIEQHPEMPSWIFLAAGNGVMRTTDAGESWRIMTDWRITEALDIAIDPNSTDSIYLATARGIWKSDDLGTTWREAGAGLDSPFTNSIVVDRTQTDRILAGTEAGIYESTDGAEGWIRRTIDIPILDIEQSVRDDRIWIAGTRGHGVLVSRDGGSSWKYLQGCSAEMTIHAVSIDPEDQDHFVAVGWRTGVLISEDGGANWAGRRVALPTDSFYEATFDPTTPGRIWVGTIEAGVFYSDDEGITWQTMGMIGCLVYDMVFLEEPK